MDKAARYPAIGDYAFISDCHSVALVSRTASIDWCCMPRLDAASTFGRILDWDRGGYCSIRPTSAHETSRVYLDDTLVLETTFRTRATAGAPRHARSPSSRTTSVAGLSVRSPR